MKRRTFLGSAALGAVTLSKSPAADATKAKTTASPAVPVVWPVMSRRPADIRTFSGHTNTVMDIVGRIGVPPSLVIFSEGNHLMALLSDEIIGAFPIWAKKQDRYSDLTFDNIVVATMPQPIVVQMVRTGAIALGNLTLEITRASGLYPDIVMGGSAPLRDLRKLAVLEPQARYFSKNRGRALVVRKGNPLAIHSIADAARIGARVGHSDSVEATSRANNRAAIESLVGKNLSDAFFAREVDHFPGRTGITHRDVPEMLARGYADVGLTQYHLISHWARTFPDLFELVPIAGAENLPVKIAFGRVVDPLRRRPAQAFEEFFFSRARDVYPHYDFARMTDAEFGETVLLD